MPQSFLDSTCIFENYDDFDIGARYIAQLVMMKREKKVQELTHTAGNVNILSRS